MQVHFNHTTSPSVENGKELRPSTSGAATSAQRNNPFGSSYRGLPGSQSSAAGGGWTGFISSLWRKPKSSSAPATGGDHGSIGGMVSQTGMGTSRRFMGAFTKLAGRMAQR
jgi:hypothetical protein